LDDWAEIRHLHSTKKISKREVARRLSVSRGTVDRALTPDRAPTYQPAGSGSSFDAFAQAARALSPATPATPAMPAATIAERVGWAGSESLFRSKIAEIRPDYRVPDPVDRLVHPPGYQMQCDLWFPHEDIPLSHDQVDRPPVLVMTSASSGYIQGRMLPTRTTQDLLGGMWSLLQEAQALPSRLLWDNETGIGFGKLTQAAAAFAGTLGCEIKLLAPRDPESKGMVERMNRFFRSRFMPGRTFASPVNFNSQMAAWLRIANSRFSRSRRGRPSDLVVADRAAMRALPPVAPEVLFRNSVRLPRDYMVRAFSNDYSVDPSLIGRIVHVTAGLDQVNVHHDGVLVTSHPRQWAKQLNIVDPAHVIRAGELRNQFRSQHRKTPVLAGMLAVVESASLESYDTLFGLNSDAPTSLASAS
jgi:transposase